MEPTETTLKTKLVQLRLNVERTDTILASGKYEVIERHQVALKATISEVNHQKHEVEAQKIAQGQDVIEIGKWVTEIDEKMSEADREVDRLQEWREDHKRRSEEKQYEEQLKLERELHEARMKFQSELQAVKVGPETHPKSETSNNSPQAKLPKLKITEFNGSYQDWPRFWSQYIETIDKTGIPSVTKFAYLRELLEPKVRRNVEALPFTSEGYNRAKSILQDKYGNEAEIIKAYTSQIFDLPTIPNVNVGKIHEFSDRLLYAVQSLQTMKKLEQVNGNVAMTLDKLPAIRGDLVRTDPAWESWDFLKLTEALRLWTRRNPIDSQARDKPTRPPDDNFRKRDSRPSRVYNTQQRSQQRTHLCAYCDAPDHKSSNCQTVKTASERKKVLAQKRLCFNCAKPSHRASECTSKITCQNCSRKHHTSICDTNLEDSKEQMLGAHKTDDADVVYPVVLVEVDGIKTRALLDTGAGSSYASAKLINALRKQPVETKTKKIEMMIASTTTKVEIYNAEVKSVDGKFNMNVNFTKVHKPELLWLENPKYKELMSKYSHLEDVHMDDDDMKCQLPVHLVLGAAEYSRIKTEARPRVGGEYEPVGELTKLGWVLMAPGQEFDRDVMLLTQTSQADYDQLCRLDVLGLEDSAEHDQQTVYTEFKEQLTRAPEGWYETSLPWKGNHPPLPNNHSGSLRRLDSLVRKLRRSDGLMEYDAVIQDQLNEGVVEKAPTTVSGREFYIPHRAVVRETAETTKLRVVYDASARAFQSAPSLNECLHAGPPLQNKLWGVLTRNRFHAVAVAGDIRKAFLQVRIRESERDALRFHWLADAQSKEVQTLRFTRALFGLAPSPFLLGGVIEQHLESWRDRRPGSVHEVTKSLYVDDLISGRSTVAEAKQLKSDAIEIFADATFTLHKWHSNVPALESTTSTKDEGEQSFAKEQLGVLAKGECKLLGLPWNKTADTLNVSFPDKPAELTKRGILANLAKVYDPLGLVSPVTLGGKLIYRDACNLKTAWDAPLPTAISTQWVKWERALPESVATRRSLVTYQEPINAIQLHAFGDASGHGVGTAIYAVVTQDSGVTQGLVVAKSRLAKQGLTIPRLELVAGHMAVNLAVNVRTAMEGFPLEPTIQCWLDSSVALHWIRGQGEYRQFVANRIGKIQSHPDTLWRHVPTTANPADLSSRGGRVTEADLWWHGPEWLSDRARWPTDIVTGPSQETRAEQKLTKELFACAIDVSDEFDGVLEKFGLSKAMRVCAWVSRFTHNSRHATNKISGPLKTEEIAARTLFWVKRAQQEGMSKPSFPEDQQQLNLQRNAEEVLECRGRIQGVYPVYLPDSALYTAKVVQRAHVTTLHGGVTLTMAKVREKLWVPRLRKLTKQVIKRCWGCKRFQAVAVKSPPPGLLPRDRTEGNTPFSVIGVDFAGPVKYRVRRKTEGKAYVVLYSCSLTRGIFMELLPSLETQEFIRSMKRFIARRGRPTKVYSDNGKTFVAAAKWLKTARNDERFNDFLANADITWQFNLSRAPWWGGQFERLIGLVKTALYKTIGQGLLTWSELGEVLLDVEISVNNRPLSYMEEDIQFPTLTPNSLLFVNSNVVPELDPAHLQDEDLRKRARYLTKCKDALWRRWSTEYLRALRERHHLKTQAADNRLAPGDVVIIKEDQRNRNCWKLGIIDKLIVGRDGIVRAAKLRAGKAFLERAIQHLYPLELSCDRTTVAIPAPLNPEAPTSRPQRDAAVAANLRVQDLANAEHGL